MYYLKFALNNLSFYNGRTFTWKINKEKFDNLQLEVKNIINTIINPNTGREFIAFLIIPIVILLTKKVKRKYTN